MSFDQQNIHFAIGRHKDFVRAGERRALQIADGEPRPAVSGRLCRKAIDWLGAQWVSRGRSLLHPGAMPAHSKQSVG